METGFVLSCEGMLREERVYLRLVDAVADAVQLARALEAQVQIFDVEGRLADTWWLNDPDRSAAPTQMSFYRRQPVISRSRVGVDYFIE